MGSSDLSRLARHAVRCLLKFRHEMESGTAPLTQHEQEEAEELRQACCHLAADLELFDLSFVPV